MTYIVKLYIEEIDLVIVNILIQIDTNTCIKSIYIPTWICYYHYWLKFDRWPAIEYLFLLTAILGMTSTILNLNRCKLLRVCLSKIQFKKVIPSNYFNNNIKMLQIFKFFQIIFKLLIIFNFNLQKVSTRSNLLPETSLYVDN
jgi:hypothetical protein